MSDDWVIENLRVTLFSPKHKERVIIQNSRDDLRITSRESEESIRQDVGGKATTDKGAAKKKDAPAESAATPTAAPASPAAAAPGPAPAAAANEVPPARTNGSLKWQPTEDAGYAGFAAESRDGEFVVLKTEKSLWALYFSWGRGVHINLGCFWELAEARTAAQKQHDEGPVARPNGKITQEMVDKACPAPPEAAPASGAAPASAPAAAPAAPNEAAAPSADTPRTPPRRARTRSKKAAESEPAKEPEPPAGAPERGTPEADEIEIEIDPAEANKMLGQLKGLLENS